MMMEIKDLRAGYEGRAAIDGINARFEPGKLTAVIGPNGCGKSTLLKCAAGILRPMDGNVRVGDKDLMRMSRREQAKIIAYMPQSRFAPDISVKRLAIHGRYPHLRWGRQPGEADMRIVDEALRRTGMDEYAHRPVAQLSGGERQKAYIAMMLAQDAPVLLLDEPAAALDISAQFMLMDLLKELCAGGRTVIAVMHDLSMAMEYAHSIMIMDKGAQAFFGAPEAAYDSGKLQAVFGVEAERTPSGRYLFSGKK